MRLTTLLRLFLVIAFTSTLIAQEAKVNLPSESLKFGAFTARFDPGGTFTIASTDWPPVKGNWKTEGNQIGFDVVEDQCQIRRMIIDRSTWSPASEVRVIPVRNIVRTGSEKTAKLP